MDKETIYDLIIIGLGPAGMEAAKVAAKSGLKVLAFESNAFGGCCLNRGCIPTKTILHSSEIYCQLKNSLKLGIESKDSPVDFNFINILKRTNEIIQKIQKAGKTELLKIGVEIIEEKATADFENLVVNNKYKAKNIIVAQGSKPFELSNLPFDCFNVLSSDDILNLKELPKSVAIIGSGAIGVEWARIFSSFGSSVSLVEKADSILPLMDIDIQKRMKRILKVQKVRIFEGKSAVSFSNGKLILDDSNEIETEKILVAVGRKRNIPNGLLVNKDCTTNYKNVYAIGDVASTKMLAHTASMQARYVVSKIEGKKSPLIPDSLIPSVIYGKPEAASIGINEQEIKVKEGFKIYNLPLSFLPKSWCDNQIDGFIKLVSDENEKIIGGHIVSPEASSLISTIQVIIKNKMTVSDIEDIVFAHPTYSEGIVEAIKNG